MKIVNDSGVGKGTLFYDDDGNEITNDLMVKSVVIIIAAGEPVVAHMICYAKTELALGRVKLKSVIISSDRWRIFLDVISGERRTKRLIAKANERWEENRT